MTSFSQKILRSTGQAKVLKLSLKKGSAEARFISAKIEEITLLDYLESCENAGVVPGPLLRDYVPVIRS
jgi:hypothetical protein